MDSKDRKEIIRRSMDMSLNFGAVCVLFCLLVRIYFSESINILFFLFLLLMLCDIAVVGLCYKRLEILLDGII